jgi:hypothetical protein
MKKLFIFLFMTICTVGAIYLANATPSTVTMPTNAASTKSALTKMNALYYLTFISGNFNPASAPQTQVCPIGSTFVSGSTVTVTSVPQLSSTLPNGGIMWQCLMSLGFWVSSSGVTVLDPTGLPSGLTNPGVATTLSSINWQSYTPLGTQTYYTGYQFPNNAYVPVGVGGSGLGCGSAGGQGSVTCTANGISINPYSSGGGTWIYYVQPNQSLSCTLHRDYGSLGACSGGGCPCDGTYTVGAGTALVGACCYGTWNTAITTFNNSTFTTCGGGC